MGSPKKPTADAIAILRRLFIEGRPDMEAWLEEELASLGVAEQIYLLRTQAGLTQRELAERVGTTASAVSRLERADYGRHSLSMLRRIGTALGRQVRVSFVPVPEDVEA